MSKLKLTKRLALKPTEKGNVGLPKLDPLRGKGTEFLSPLTAKRQPPFLKGKKSKASEETEL